MKLTAIQLKVSTNIKSYLMASYRLQHHYQMLLRAINLTTFVIFWHDLGCRPNKGCNESPVHIVNPIQIDPHSGRVMKTDYLLTLKRIYTNINIFINKTNSWFHRKQLNSLLLSMLLYYYALLLTNTITKYLITINVKLKAKNIGNCL